MQYGRLWSQPDWVGRTSSVSAWSALYNIGVRTILLRAKSPFGFTAFAPARLSPTKRGGSCSPKMKAFAGSDLVIVGETSCKCLPPGFGTTRRQMFALSPKGWTLLPARLLRPIGPRLEASARPRLDQHGYAAQPDVRGR